MHNEDKLHFRVRPTEPAFRVREASLPAATVRRRGRDSQELPAQVSIWLQPAEVPDGHWAWGPDGLFPVHCGQLATLSSPHSATCM